MPEFAYTDLLPLGPDATEYRLLTSDGVTQRHAFGRDFLEVDPEVLTLVAREGMRDIAHLLRPGHLRQLRAILDDPEASHNDRFVAGDLLQERVYRGRRGAAHVPGHRDRDRDGEAGRAGPHRRAGRGASRPRHLRGVHPAQPALLAARPAVHVRGAEHRHQPARPGRDLRHPGQEYKFLLMAKGGGSANKSFLYQQTKTVLNPAGHAHVPGGEDPVPGHGRLPAVPPGHRGRRHQRRVRAENRQVCLGPVPGHPSRQRVSGRPWLP